jgi:hypothetical protein
MRVSMFLRLMDYDAVFGVTVSLLDGLEASGHSPAEIFAGVRMIGAYPGAYERLGATGLAPVHFVLCGPALAIGREPDGPAIVAEAEWELAADGDGIVITSSKSRAQPFIRTPIAVRGTIVGGGVVPGPSPVGEE